MIARLIIAILMSPIWLLLSIVLTMLYAIGYVRGSNNVMTFWNAPKIRRKESVYNEYDEFDIHAK
jgi:hypothetical protein